MGEAIVIAGLGFGDEGKGSTVDYLARETKAHLVVRYNGGPQAAHNVVTPDGKHHTFAQFGSGALAGAATHLSRFMLVNPEAMFVEAEHLESKGVPDPLADVTVDRDALIVTRYHMAANRIRELLRGDARHGSCGMGVGDARSDEINGLTSIYARDLSNERMLLAKLHAIRAAKIAEFASYPDPFTGQAAFEDAILMDEERVPYYATLYGSFARQVSIVEGADVLKRALRSPGTVIFEGAQGVLLDEVHGFHPYTTWTNTTFDNAHTLLGEAEAFFSHVKYLGVLRAMATRHGPGPFVTEDAALTLAHPDTYNVDNAWQRSFRVGHFDAVAASHAVKLVGGLDGLVLTHLDNRSEKVCIGYTHPNRPGVFGNLAELAVNTPEQPDLAAALSHVIPIYQALPSEASFINLLQWATDVPVLITSHGPKATDKSIKVALTT